MNRGTRFVWNNINISKHNSINSIINFGPQHPASHGVLRMVLELRGEIINNVDIHIGFLHRSSEKLMTDVSYIKALPYFDRLDYVSMLSQEHAFCLAVERLLSLDKLASGILMLRVLLDELTRLLNHFLAISCHALDIGSMTCIF
jgi:NADH:ubiquinone oxidoreductase subunit D